MDKASEAECFFTASFRGTASAFLNFIALVGVAVTSFIIFEASMFPDFR